VAANPDLLHYVKKNTERISGSAANSSSSSVHAKRGSPGNNADDDKDANKGPAPTHRTLPGYSNACYFAGFLYQIGLSVLD